MRKRRWTIEWHATPQADGVERLGRAIELLIKQGMSETGSKDQRPRRDELEQQRDDEASQ